MKRKKSFVVEVKNFQGKRVIFTEEQLQIKAMKRPELKDASFLHRIAETIKSPDLVIEDYLKPKKRWVYYKEEYRINNHSIYTKVVVACIEEPHFVITAYRPDYIKEYQYQSCKIIYEKDKTSN